MTVAEGIAIYDRIFVLVLLGLTVRACRRIDWVRLWAWLTSIESVVIDGGLAVCVAMFLMAQTVFGSEEAYKYCNPYFLFFVKAFFGVIGSGFGALKAFRSIEYYRHSRNKKRLRRTR